jgi:hypothetical protein
MWCHSIKNLDLARPVGAICPHWRQLLVLPLTLGLMSCATQEPHAPTQAVLRDAAQAQLTPQNVIIDLPGVPPPRVNGLLPLDPGSQGYRVDNNTLKFVEHVRKPERIDLKNEHWIDQRWRIANLIADENGDYAKEAPNLRVVLLDSQTGEVKPMPYKGSIDCFANGNIYISRRGKTKRDGDTSSTDVSYAYGHYLGPLTEQMFTVTPGDRLVPTGYAISKKTCTLQPILSIEQRKTFLKARESHWPLGINFTPEHGVFFVPRGVSTPGNHSEYPPVLQKLMSNAFMGSMDVMSPFQRWLIIQPDGKNSIDVPMNPGEEAAPLYVWSAYVPYLDAYFIGPYLGGRPFDPPEFRDIPRFARIIYPDGRVLRYGIPDVIWQAAYRKELKLAVSLSRIGLIWEITKGVNYRHYNGDLKPDTYYLDLREQKTLRRLPDLSLFAAIGNLSADGCIAHSGRRFDQIKPWGLLTTFFINLCTGE